MNLIEVTDVTNDSIMTVNVDNVDVFVNCVNSTMIIFPTHNIIVKETYKKIKSLLNQMIK